MSSSLPRRPLLPGLYHVVALGPDRVQVLNAGRAVMLSGDGFTARVVPLLAALDGKSSLEELRARFPDLIPAVLDGLLARGLLTDAAEDPDGPRAAPQLAALALGDGPAPAEAAARLAAATVAVVGCGPVGATVAVLLAKAGVGRLVLADPDALSVTDIAVSPVLGPRARGLRRAEATGDAVVEASAAEVEIAASPLPEDRLAGLDLAVVEATNREDGSGPGEADACLATRVPYLRHGQDALEAFVGPFVAAGGSPCHRCADDRRLSHVPDLEAHLAYRRHREAVGPRADAFLAAHSSLVAGLVASAALGALLETGPLLSGGVLVVELAALALRREELLAVPGCPGCAQPAAAALRARSADAES